MAYELQPFDDEEKDKPAGMMSGGVWGASGGPAGAPGATAPATPQPTTGPGGFVNFGRYQSANQGDANRMVSGVASDAESKASKAQAGLTGAQSAFYKGLQGGNPFASQPVAPTTAGTFGAATAPVATGLGRQFAQPAPMQNIGTPTPYTTPGGTSRDAGGGLTSVRQGQQGTPQRGPGTTREGAPGTIGIEEGRRRATAAYTGPRSFEDVSDWKGLLSEGRGAQGMLDALSGRAKAGEYGRGDAGVQALLDQRYGRGSTSNRGSSRFDAALAGAAGRGRFKELSKRYGDLYGRMESSANQAANAGARTAQEVGDTAAEYGRQVADYDTIKASQSPPPVPVAVGEAGTASLKAPYDQFAAGASRHGDIWNQMGMGGKNGWEQNGGDQKLYESLSSAEAEELQGILRTQGTEGFGVAGGTAALKAFIAKMKKKYGG